MSDCEHNSATNIDDTPAEDPAKLWRCDDCGVLTQFVPVDSPTVGRVEVVTCSMCEEEPATTTWGLPVCQPCYDGLISLDADLKQMEAEDPDLAEKRRRVDEATQRWWDAPDG